MSLRARLTVALASLFGVLPLFAQEQADADSLVRLMSAQSVHVVQVEGDSYREVIGPARFLHNNTYLVCDTAIWHVDAQLINAFGHVQILQDETVLSSDKLDYFIEDDRAEFRGTTVQLQDKQNNTLRTRYLDYNTKDSVAVFRNGGAMRDKDGQIMESSEGTYDSKTKLFDFVWTVNMYVDSVFVKTEHLRYYGNSDIAEFDTEVFAWQDDKMLSANYGQYDKSNEKFTFFDNVHAMSKDQEAWGDSLYFYRADNVVELMGHAQLLDTTRNVTAVADYIKYVDSLSTVTLERNASIAAITEEEAQKDTLYMGSDKIVYLGIKKNEIPPEEIAASKKRVEDMNYDPFAKAPEPEPEVTTTPEDKKSDEEVAEEEVAPDDEEYFEEEEEEIIYEDDEEIEKEPLEEEEELLEEDPSEVEEEAPSEVEEDPVEEEEAPAEEEAEPETEQPVALEPAPEPEPEVLDSSVVAWVTAMGNVKVFRNDVQAICDSLTFIQLDSIVRLYKTPVIWNEQGEHQYAADSIALRIESGHLEQASLMSNSFVVIREAETSFDQIKSTEMMAYFDTTGTLRRFDALGGATALFYLKENDALATVNKVDCKTLSAYLSDGELEKIYYFENPHNDAYPLVKLPKEERELKGFDWREKDRPVGPRSVTPLRFRDSERGRYSNIKKGQYKQADRYFPGYMDDVYKMIAERDSLRAVQQREAELLEQMEKEDAEQEELLADELLTDELEEAESPLEEMPEMEAESEMEADPSEEPEFESEPEPEPEAEAEPASVEESEAEPEAVAGQEAPEPPAKPVVQEKPKEPKLTAEQKRAQREQNREQRLAQRDEKWAELDARDAEKEARKAEKLAAKNRAKKLKLLRAEEKRAAKEQKILDRYIRRYEKQKARREAATQRKAE